jgi:hypothetical protein
MKSSQIREKFDQVQAYLNNDKHMRNLKKVKDQSRNKILMKIWKSK